MTLRVYCVLMTCHLLLIEVQTQQTRDTTLTSLTTLAHRNLKHNENDELQVIDNYRKPWQINRNICPHTLCNHSHHQLPTIPPDNTQEQGAPPSEHAKQTFPFFEGDLVLDKEMHRIIEERRSLTSRRKKRAIVKPITRLWPAGVVPYVIDTTLDSVTTELIHKTFQHFANYTCLKFRPKTDKDVDYLVYINDQGCWSQPGNIGGQQLLSLGQDCAQFGTVVHETGHALGFWHEQARPDRDKYVKIIKKNVEDDEATLKQFLKHTENEATSRGYAYDYQSIMHYGENYFSVNESPTIQVIGIGKKFKFKIGQRRRLSELDIAQLNDMYNCHKKEADKIACQHGWIKFRSSCYKFEFNKSESFFEASASCRLQRGYLVIINSIQEDTFLKTHLINHYSNSTSQTWTTAGIRMTSTSPFVWYIPGSNGRHMEIKFNVWLQEPSAQDRFLVLSIIKTTHPHFVWKAQTAGLQQYHPFICEAKTQIPCFKSSNNSGRDYRGHLSYTNEGITCQKWSQQYPHNHTMLTHDKLLDQHEGLGDHNHCRNPRGARKQPWCYTLKTLVKWQYCDVPIC